MNGKILVVDDVSTNRIVFKVKLTAAGYRMVMAGDGASCLAQARSEMPDLILLDLWLRDMSGLDVLTRLKADPRTRRIPVVMFSAEQDARLRVAALKAGAEDFLSRPVDDQTLFARLRGILRAREVMGDLASPEDGLDVLSLAEPAASFEMPGMVAMIMGRADQGLHLRKQLSGENQDRFSLIGHDAVFADNTDRSAPDVYLIDADAGGPGGGLRLMSELLSRSTTRHAAFCIYNQQSPSFVAATAFDLGANEVVDAEISPPELAVRLHALVRRKREADRRLASVQDGLRLAVIDPLTGLHNRRYGMAQLTAIASQARENGQGFAIMVADLDRFKRVNDQWGHAAGDTVLVEVAARLAANLRAGDLLARIGGEEFLIALPATTYAEAEAAAGRLCRAIESAPVMLADGTRINATISIGMTVSDGNCCEPGSDAMAGLIDLADRALMKSKSGGRNQVTILRNAA